MNSTFLFVHGKSNSCGVATGFYRTKTLERLLKLQISQDVLYYQGKKLDETICLLVNIYNANTETE